MVSFDVVSLFTNVPIVDSLELLSHHFEGVLALLKHVLTSKYFSLMANSMNKLTGSNGLITFSGNCKFLHGGF
jgi:hypothetical protein